MAIEGISKDILLITLPEQPQNGNEIDLVNKMFSDVVDHDVVMDFEMSECSRPLPSAAL